MSMHDDDQSSSSRAASGSDGDSSSTASEAETTGADTPSEPATVEEQLAAATKEAADNFERFLRAKADIENILKRHQREMADRSRYDGEALARDILPAVDDLERALEHAGEGAEGVSGGVELVLKGLVTALKRNGVEKIDADGKPFDPADHEAVTMVESADVAPGTVISVFRPGYRIKERLLRAAMVAVSKAPEANG